MGRYLLLDIGAGTRIWHFCHVMPAAVIGARCSIGQNVVVMNGDTTVVDASVPQLILDGALAEVADFGEAVGPMLELR